MQMQIIKFEKNLDRLSKRDQIALFITFLVAVLMIWSKLVYQPLSGNLMVIEKDVAQKTTQIEVLQAKMLVLNNNIKADPDAQNRQQLEKLKQENSRLDDALARTSVQIINPREMTSLLEQLLKTQTGLKFVSLKNKQAAPEFIESRGELEATVENVNTIYRHSVVLQMEGSYHDTLSYLKKLEQLPWRFFWQGVEIEARGYPNTLTTLEVYTLGFREGLVGA